MALEIRAFFCQLVDGLPTDIVATVPVTRTCEVVRGNAGPRVVVVGDWTLATEEREFAFVAMRSLPLALTADVRLIGAIFDCNSDLDHVCVDYPA